MTKEERAACYREMASNNPATPPLNGSSEAILPSAHASHSVKGRPPTVVSPSASMRFLISATKASSPSRSTQLFAHAPKRAVVADDCVFPGFNRTKRIMPAADAGDGKMSLADEANVVGTLGHRPRLT